MAITSPAVGGRDEGLRAIPAYAAPVLTLFVLTSPRAILAFAGYGFAEDAWGWWWRAALESAPTAGVLSVGAALAFYLAIPNPAGASARRYAPPVAVAMAGGVPLAVYWGSVSSRFGASLAQAVVVPLCTALMHQGVARLAVRAARGRADDAGTPPNPREAWLAPASWDTARVLAGLLAPVAAYGVINIDNVRIFLSQLGDPLRPFHSAPDLWPGAGAQAVASGLMLFALLRQPGTAGPARYAGATVAAMAAAMLLGVGQDRGVPSVHLTRGIVVALVTVVSHVVCSQTVQQFSEGIAARVRRRE